MAHAQLQLFKILNNLVYATITVSPKKGPIRDFPGGPAVNTLPSNAGSVGTIPGWGTKITACLEMWPQSFFLKKVQSTAEKLLRLQNQIITEIWGHWELVICINNKKSIFGLCALVLAQGS